MGDNNTNSFENGRIRIVDPNNFNELYGGNNIFGLKSNNFSVPTEDLCIIVELKTNTKNRTILNTNEKTNSKFGVKGQTVSFIDGTSGVTTGNQNYLTTQYTELGTETDSLGESLGITSIDIDFNSSYAPMVNINFVDVKGGAIFQPGGESKYAVLFQLPYPLFELKVKGFYGKPVTYCLHLIKCNSKFNSQTGNFEIAAQFVGYTYAMLSDMLIGYLKAAVMIPEGKELLKNKKLLENNKFLAEDGGESNSMISINDFIAKMGNIDGLIKSQLKETNPNANNLSIITQLAEIISQIKLGINNTLNTLGINYPAEKSPVDGDPRIIIIKNPTNGSLNDFNDSKNSNETIPTFNKNYFELVKSFNEKAGDIEGLKIKNDIYPIQTVVNIEEMYNNSTSFNDEIKKQYKINEPSVIDLVVERLKSFAYSLSLSNRLIKFYDFTDIINNLDKTSEALAKYKEDVEKLVAEDLRSSLRSELGFDPTIRNIIMMLTSHVEVFLDLLYNVSARYKESTRLSELKIFETDNTKLSSIDVNNDTKRDGLIYPWPEYIQNGKEAYLGSKKGPLKNPLIVPEIKFVEDIYQAMITVAQQESNLTSDGPKAWNSFNPIDSFYYSDSGIIKPYDRLDDNAKPDDVVRLMMLRGIGFLGFSNFILTPEEIAYFAESEAKLVLSKFDPTPTILQAIKNYSLDNFTSITGIINGKVSKLLNLNDKNYEYSYINNQLSFRNVIYNRFILPVDKGFTNVNYGLNNESASDYKITNYSCFPPIKNDSVKYLDFIEVSEYNNKDATSPSSNPQSSFSFENLNTDEKFTAENIKSVGFLSNNGKYGVQEFNLINYPSNYGTNGDIPFFSLFYDSILDDNENWAYPAICSLKKTGTTEFDLEQKNGFSVLIDGENNEKINAIYKNYESGGKNIAAFSKISIQTELAYPFLEFGVDQLTRKSLPTGLLLPTLLIKNAFKTNYRNQFSLFTSRFYNAQTLRGRTLLFLHSFPWRGLYGIKDNDSIGLLKQPSILNALKYRTGFVQIPKLWPAFIGGLLWRNREGLSTGDPIIFNVNGEYLLPRFTSSSKTPKYDSYLKHNASKMSMAFNSTCEEEDYIKLEDEITSLPLSVKEKFISEFDKFVEEYKTIKNVFEVIPKNNKGYNISTYDTLSSTERDMDWKAAFDGINNDATYNSSTNKATGTVDNINGYLKTTENNSFRNRYSVFTYFVVRDGSSDVYNYNYITEYKNNSIPDNKLKELFFDYKYLSNNTLSLWWNDSELKCDSIPFVSKEALTIYINKFIEIVKTSVEEKEKKYFSNNDDEQVKLEIYRTLKKIYDKWLADTSKEGNGPSASNDVLFQCCKLKSGKEKGRLNTDVELSKKRGGNEVELIDSFRFITRSFEDIGDIFQINPLTVSKMLLTSGNNNFYDVVGRILNDNNFEFIALPNFVDYNNPERVKEIFTPYPYYESANEADTGPSFVCVYVGQTSTKLDFGKNSLYPDDGFNFTDVDSIPLDFTTTGKTYEDRGAAFIVKYGNQNQNLFKDIVIDQAEFNETAESINVTDAIANRFSQASQTYVGQNLYNIYSIRSYKVEIEMMGDAMIQPMMYFQLDNIPMFRGAYLITRVRHNIKPNYMSTHFTGTRVNRNQTPLVSVSSLFTSMLNGYELPPAKQNASISNITNRSVPPIVVTIKENGGTNGNITQGNITRTAISFPSGILNNVKDESIEILTEAVAPLKAMLTEWVSWMKANGFKGNNGNYAYINSAYRTYENQVAVKIIYGDLAAEPSTSRHGWGIAVDFKFLDKNGNLISNYVRKKANVNIGFDINKNPAIKWLYDNSYRFGWIIPPSLRDNIGTEEFWHWEYHGTAAKCILQQNTNIKGYIVNIDKNYDTSVTNPKKPDGTIPDYTNCSFTSIKEADGGSISSSNGEDSILCTYLLWQQGPTGARQHYKVSKGLMNSYTISVNKIIDNWPSGAISDDGVKASDIRTLYNTNPKKLANAFINVWDNTISKKRQEALALIESSKKNRTQQQYLTYKDIFKKHEKPSDGIDWKDLATMAFIENALCSDTNPSETYQGILQMNKTYPEFSSILNTAKKGSSGYKNYVDYDVDKVVQGAVPIFVKNLESFSKDTGYIA